VPRVARGVLVKHLPGCCGDDPRLFAQIVSLCWRQLPLPEKTPMLKTVYHNGTQISVG